MSTMPAGFLDASRAAARRGHRPELRDIAGGTADSTALGDVGELYGAFSKRLEQIVRRGVHAPEAVIEDACQVAWSRLLHHGTSVRRDTALGWLVKTAFHEALKLARRDRRELSLDLEIERSGEARLPPSEAEPHEMLERREQLAEIGRLPYRQQRLLWLRGLGLSYEELALHEACTTRTVDRQLGRARRSLRAANGE